MTEMQTTAGVSLTEETIRNLPTELQDRPQWCLWRWQEKAGGGTTKVPYTARGSKADSTNPATWCSFADAVAAWRGGDYAGIGFVFQASDPWIGIDFDGCADAEEGSMRFPEVGWLEAIDSYAEYSPSGTGVKVIIKGKLPEGCKHGFGQGNGIYSAGRFFTITGKRVSAAYGEIREVSQPKLQAMLDVWFPTEQKLTRWTEEQQRYPDDEVLRLLHAAKNRDKFISLFRDGDTTDYASHSEADTALVSLMAFYTGTVTQQIDRLFRDSALWREKWDEARVADPGKWLFRAFAA